jgi:hypothetical protein
MPSVEIEEELAARDPREDTRRTPLPSRPGEGARRVPRDDTRRPQAEAASGGRSWAWLGILLVLLGVVGGALAVSYPSLRHLMPWEKEVESGPPPATPIEVPAAEVPKPPPPEPAPAAAEKAAAPAAPGSADASGKAALGEEELLPLALGPGPTAKKPPTSTKTSKKASRKEGELQKEWSQTSKAFIRLTGVLTCDDPKIGNLCNRFEGLQSEVEQAGDSNDKELIGKVKRLRKEIMSKSASSP